MLKKIGYKLLPMLNKTDKKDSKYLVIPDLHGRLSIFKRVDQYIRENSPKDRDRVVIFLGDYFDRGESLKVYGREFNDGGSYHVLEAIFNLKKWANENGVKIIFLKGNHEQLYEDFFIKNRPDPYDRYAFFRESVEAFEFAFENDPSLYPRLEEFLGSLLPYYLDKIGGYLFVHAGVDFSVGSLKAQEKKGTLFWIREDFIYSEKKLPYRVIFGHTPFEEIFIKDDRIGLDCGVYENDYINVLKIDNSDLIFLKL